MWWYSKYNWIERIWQESEFFPLFQDTFSQSWKPSFQLLNSAKAYTAVETAMTFELICSQNVDWHCAIDITHILALCHSLHHIFLKFAPILLLNGSTSGIVPSYKANFWHCAISNFWAISWLAKGLSSLSALSRTPFINRFLVFFRREVTFILEKFFRFTGNWSKTCNLMIVLGIIVVKGQYPSLWGVLIDKLKGNPRWSIVVSVKKGEC